MKPPDRPGPVIFMRIVMAGVGAMGLAAFVSGLRLVASGGPNRAGAVVAVLMGAALTALTTFFFYWSFVTLPREQQRTGKLRVTNPGEPWMQRADWAARRISHARGGIAVGLWIWTVGWCGLLGFVSSVNYGKIVAELGRSWGAWALLALFVGCGLLGLVLALKFSWSWWRYGTSVLLLDSLPAVPGGRLRATLDAKLGSAPFGPLEIELVCEELQTITSGQGKDRSSRTDVLRLGHSTAVIEAARFMRSRDRVRVPAEIDVPSNLPGWSLDERGNGVRWVLRFSAMSAASDYSAEFEVPVFRR